MIDMKHIRLCFAIIIFITALLSMQACNKNMQETFPSECIQVKLGFCGDIDISAEPLTKGASDGNLYGVQVYFDNEQDGVTDDYYGYGLFDNTADMVLSVLSGYTYRFVCTAVFSGKNTLYYGQYGGSTFSGYGKPFQTNAAASSMLTNEFTLGADTYFTGLTCGAATTKAANGSYLDQDWPAIERYYGELDGYTTSAGQNVTISLKKCYYAVRFILKGVEGGTLATTMTYPSPGGTESFSTTTTDYDSGVLLRSFYNVSDCSNLSASVNWSFTSSIFSQWNLTGSKTITLKRNTLTTITVSVTPDDAGGFIGINEESLGDTNNIDMYINSDGLIDIYVEPSEEDD